jgi:hypothetical protein
MRPSVLWLKCHNLSESCMSKIQTVLFQSNHPQRKPNCYVVWGKFLRTFQEELGLAPRHLACVLQQYLEAGILHWLAE